jgi:hypothetical protein
MNKSEPHADDLPLDPLERVMDGLLSELLGGVRPPDLSAEILERWASDDRPSTVRLDPRRTRMRRMIVAGSGVAAVAASLGLIAWGLGTTERLQPSNTSVAAALPRAATKSNEPLDPPGRPPAANVLADPSTTPPAANPPVAIQLDTSDVPFAQSEDRPGPTDIADHFAGPPPSSARAGRPSRMRPEQIVAEIDRLFEQFWTRKGFAEVQDAEAPEFVDRLHLSLTGIPAPSEQRDALVEQLTQTGPLGLAAQFVESSGASAHIGQRLAAMLVGHAAWERLSKAEQEQLTELVSPLSLGRKTYDQFLSETLSARGSIDPSSPQFNQNLRLLSAWNSSQQMDATKRIARLCFAQSIGCAQCHDDSINGGLEQRSFWNLNALVRNDLQWSNSNVREDRTTASGSIVNAPAVFFESLDGRQRVAEPTGIAAFVGKDLTAIPSLEQLVVLADEDGRLGRAAADLTWQFLFGESLVSTSQPLSGSSADAELIAVQSLLAEQTRAYDYHLPTVVGWLMSSRVYRTAGVDPVQLTRGPDALAAIEAARRRTQAWAAFKRPGQVRSLEKLLKLSELWTGGSVSGSDEQTLLAQLAPPTMMSRRPATPGSVANSSQEKSPEQLLLRASFPSDDPANLPLPWLEPIGRKGFESQVKHLYAWAGINDPSAEQMQAAERIRASVGGDPTHALRILHWALSESRLPMCL